MLAQFHHVNVIMDKKTILFIEELEIEKGKRYAVVGPSGSGKSTFLRLINLLQNPSSGQMTLFNETLTKKGYTRNQMISIQRQMVYVSQKPVMFDQTVAENIAMGLKYRGINKSEMEDRVQVVLEQVGLSNYGKRRAVTLSGGEAQRIALARALVIEPKLLLLDEPTSNLDPSNIEIIENVVNTIHAQSAVTVLMVTHSLQQAKRMGDEIIFIHQGSVHTKQEKEKFFHAPPIPEMADFISGKMIY